MTATFVSNDVLTVTTVLQNSNEPTYLHICKWVIKIFKVKRFIPVALKTFTEKKRESSVFIERKSVRNLQKFLYEFDVKLALRYKPKFWYLFATVRKE